MSEIREFRGKEPNLPLARKLTLIVWVLTIAVLGLVGMMRSVKIPIPESIDLSALPAFHAFLNTLAAFFLLVIAAEKPSGTVGITRWTNG